MDEILGVAAQLEPALRVAEMNAFYGERQVLRDVAFEAQRGSVTAVIGPSGCGKSTLLACLNRTIEDVPGARWRGDVLLRGEQTAHLSADELRARVGLVMQQPTPFPFSIERNIAYGLRFRGVRNRRRLREAAETYLDMVGLLGEIDGDVRRSALELSGGQQQRLCIARALALEPDVLLFDEPCSALDVASSATVEAAVGELKKCCAVVVVTHNLAQARRIADSVVCMDAGRVVWQGGCAELFEEKRESVLAPLYGSELL